MCIPTFTSAPLCLALFASWLDRCGSPHERRDEGRKMLLSTRPEIAIQAGRARPTTSFLVRYIHSSGCGRGSLGPAREKGGKEKGHFPFPALLFSRENSLSSYFLPLFSPRRKEKTAAKKKKKEEETGRGKEKGESNFVYLFPALPPPP